MAKKISGWKTKGMNRDLSVSAFNPEFAFENINLRLATNDGNTTLSWVNEKGTASLPLKKGSDTITIYGTCIGTAVINDYLILFTTNNTEEPADNPQPDHIYRLKYSDDNSSLDVTELFYGDLKFDSEYPLETTVSYESENIQKVYWTDGINQPRLINIAPDNDSNINDYTNESFDFVPTLKLEEEIKVKKILGGGGMFAPGVIQYAFTYYNKYGQESNIFYTTPLYYVSYADRGASPEDKVDNTFKITVEHVDTNFDYLRIYSIQRTSINGTPICKRVQDIDISSIGWEDDTDHSKGKKPTSYIDTGYNGNAIDPTELLYKGGSSIMVGTMEQKDNTLFMGDITTPKNGIQSILTQEEIALVKNSIKDQLVTSTRDFYPMEVSTDNYEYSNQLTSYEKRKKEGSETEMEIIRSVPCAGFKFGNKYRCGIQFQDATGKWTDPIFLDDVEIENPEGINIRPDAETNVEPEDPGEVDKKVSVIVVNNSTNAIKIRNTAYIVVGNKAKLAVKLFNQISDIIPGRNGDEPIRGGDNSKTYDDAVVIEGSLHENDNFCSMVDCQSIGMPNNVILCDTRGSEKTLQMQSVPTSTTVRTFDFNLVCTGTEDPAPLPEKSVTVHVTIYNNSGEEKRFNGAVYFITKGDTGYSVLKGICSGNDFVIPKNGSTFYTVTFTDSSTQTPSACTGRRFAGSSERGGYLSNNAYDLNNKGYTCVDFDSTGTEIFKDHGNYTMIITEDTQEWNDSPTPPGPEPGDDNIKFVITNNCGEEVRLSGKVILNLSRDPNDWANSTQANANFHDSYSGSFDRNDIIIPPGGTYTGTAASIKGIYSPGTNFTDGTWYFMNSDSGVYVHAFYLYARIWSRSRDEYSGSNHMYVVRPLQNTIIQKGATYYLDLYWKNDEAYLATASTTKSDVPSDKSYAILAEGKTSLA